MTNNTWKHFENFFYYYYAGDAFDIRQSRLVEELSKLHFFVSFTLYKSRWALEVEVTLGGRLYG